MCSAPSTTLAVVRMPLSSTATPVPARRCWRRTRSPVALSRCSTVRCTTMVTMEGSARRTMGSTWAPSPGVVPCARAGSAGSNAKRTANHAVRPVARRPHALNTPCRPFSERDDRLLPLRAGWPRRDGPHGDGAPLQRGLVEDELDVLAMVEHAVGDVRQGAPGGDALGHGDGPLRQELARGLDAAGGGGLPGGDALVPGAAGRARREAHDEEERGDHH